MQHQRTRHISTTTFKNMSLDLEMQATACDHVPEGRWQNEKLRSGRCRQQCADSLKAQGVRQKLVMCSCCSRLTDSFFFPVTTKIQYHRQSQGSENGGAHSRHEQTHNTSRKQFHRWISNIKQCSKKIILCVMILHVKGFPAH